MKQPFASLILVISAIALSILAAHSRGIGAVGDSWPMFQHDAQHSGRSQQIGPQSAALAWSFPTAGVPGSPAVGDDGVIYLPTGLLNEDTAGVLYAINPNGSQKWQLPMLILPSTTAPAIGRDGMIYVHGNGDEGNAVAVEKLLAITPSGAVSWTFEFNGGAGIFTSDVQSSPTIGTDGVIYVGSMDTNLYAINPNGTLKWARSPSASSITSTPVLAPDGNTVYIVDASTKLYAYSTSGVLQWDYSLHTPPVFTSNGQSPSVWTDGMIYVGSPDEHLYAIKPNGELRWRFHTGSDIDSTPAIGSDGVIYMGSDGLYAINPNGTQKWKFASPLFSSASPIVGGDGLIYWRESWKAYAVNPGGTEKWNLDVIPFPSNDSSPVLGMDGTIYLPTAKFFDSGQNGLNAYASSQSPTPTSTATPTLTPTSTSTSTPTPTSTKTSTATQTPTNTPTPTSAATPTLTPTSTNTSTTTQTPTNTPTPTSIATPSLTPTSTSTPTATDVSIQASLFLPIIQQSAATTTAEPTETPTATPTAVTPTPTSTPTGTVAPTAIFANVLSFDGADDSASAADSASLDVGVRANDDFTLETFFYAPDETNTLGDTLIEKSGAYALSIDYNNGAPDEIIFRLWVTPFDSVYLEHAANLSAGWHHVAAVFDNEYTDDADRMVILLDGAPGASAANIEFTPGIRNTITDLEVGRSYVGWLEEMRISSAIRYAGATYDVPSAAFTPDAATRALWHFDDTPGSTTFVDGSGNVNTLAGLNGAQTIKP